MQQAKDYYNIARIAMEADNCNELMVWGLTDAITWRGGSNPLLYDSDLTPKPAYYGLHQGLRETSSTPTRITNHGLYKKTAKKVISIAKPVCIDNSAYFSRKRSQLTPIFASYQILLCLLSNVFLLAIKYCFAY